MWSHKAHKGHKVYVFFVIFVADNPETRNQKPATNPQIARSNFSIFPWGNRIAEEGRF
jgi:hypothetical protein